MPIMEKDLVHGCGRTFKYPAHYAAHGLRCDGTKPATSGRIAATTKTPDRTPPAAKRSSVQRKKKAPVKRVKRAPESRATAVPKGEIEAIAWAITQKPAAWEAGEWLARILPEGTWDEIDEQDLADKFVGAAIRARDEAAPE